MTALTDHTIDTARRNGYGRCGVVSVWSSAVQDGRRVVLFPPKYMGQYFKAANIDKQEVVCPWCIGGGAKLWEWAANRQGAIFTLLLRKSSQTGGGDYRDPLPRSERVADIGSDDPQQAARTMADAVGMAVAAEGMPASIPPNSIVGRWAEDRVVLVGDYDASGLWNDLDSYRNISRDVVETWNQFIEWEELQLEFNPNCSCSEA